LSPTVSVTVYEVDEYSKSVPQEKPYPSFLRETPHDKNQKEKIYRE
jgi:hypothetical protein